LRRYLETVRTLHERRKVDVQLFEFLTIFRLPRERGSGTAARKGLQSSVRKLSIQRLTIPTEGMTVGMNRRFGRWFVVFGLSALSATMGARAEETASAMAAPKCDFEKIQALCSDSEDCVKVEKGAWEGGYNVTSKDQEAQTRFLTEVVIKNCM